MTYHKQVVNQLVINMKQIKVGNGILDQISTPIEYRELTIEDLKDAVTTYSEALSASPRNSYFVVYSGTKMYTVINLMVEKELLLKSYNKNSKEVRKIDLEIRRVTNDAYVHQGWDYLSKPYYDLNIKPIDLDYNIFNEVDEDEDYI